MRLRLAIPLCITLGLLLSIALAWGCALFGPAEHPAFWEHDRVRVDAFRFVGNHWSAGLTRRTECVFTEDVNPATGAILLSTFADQTLRAGWPMRALECANDAWLEIPVGLSNQFRTWNGQQQLRGGWPLKTHIDATGSNVWRALPLRPVWPGFAIDWALWSLAAFAVFTVARLPAMLRRAHRRRNGQCVRCGYDLRSGGSAYGRCPECGAIVRNQP